MLEGMGTEDFLVKYRLFKEKIKEFQLIHVDEAQQKCEVKPYQLRLLSCNTPGYWFMVMDAGGSMLGLSSYKVLVLTEDISLADFDCNGVPLLTIAGICVVACLPFWIHLTEEFLRKYTVYVVDVAESVAEYMLRWAMWVKLPSEDNIRGKYVRDVMELVVSWSLGSILETVNMAECSSELTVE
jgi:hypothetical protein